MPIPSLQNWPTSGHLSEWDVVRLFDVTVPCRSVSGGIGLNIDKKKSAGTDWPTVTGKGFDVEPVRIELLLWLDTLSGTNWVDVYTRQLSPRLQPVRIERRNAVPVYHPILEEAGIRQIVIVRKSTLTHEGRQVFVVTLEGVDIRTVNPRGTATRRIKNDDGLNIPGNKKDPATKQKQPGPTAARRGKR